MCLISFVYKSNFQFLPKLCIIIIAIKALFSRITENQLLNSFVNALSKQLMKWGYYRYASLFVPFSKSCNRCFAESTVPVRCREVHNFYFAFYSPSLIVQWCCRQVGTIVRDYCIYISNLPFCFFCCCSTRKLKLIIIHFRYNDFLLIFVNALSN